MVKRSTAQTTRCHPNVCPVTQQQHHSLSHLVLDAFITNTTLAKKSKIIHEWPCCVLNLGWRCICMETNQTKDSKSQKKKDKIEEERKETLKYKHEIKKNNKQTETQQLTSGERQPPSVAILHNCQPVLAYSNPPMNGYCKDVTQKAATNSKIIRRKKQAWPSRTHTSGRQGKVVVSACANRKESQAETHQDRSSMLVRWLV